MVAASGHRLTEDHRVWPWEPILAGAVLVLIAPVALGLAISWLRRNDRARGLARRITRIDPAPTAWDFAFRGSGPFFVRLKLRGGDRIGGEFGEGSFASGYPEAQDLFLERGWTLDETGEFVGPAPGSEGLLISRDEIEVIELWSPLAERRGDGEEREISKR
jgi:hypothetical protein